jgi:hypothetical protein
MVLWATGGRGTGGIRAVLGLEVGYDGGAYLGGVSWSVVDDHCGRWFDERVT